MATTKRTCRSTLTAPLRQTKPEVRAILYEHTVRVNRVAKAKDEASRLAAVRELSMFEQQIEDLIGFDEVRDINAERANERPVDSAFGAVLTPNGIVRALEPADAELAERARAWEGATC
jgi:hypothetical protein